MKVGYLGGSFDPVHLGHLALADAALTGAGLDEVIFLVAGTPPHKLDRDLVPADDRLEMVRMAIGDRPHFTVDNRETRRAGPSYTVDTLRALRAERPSDELFWIIGADSLPELPTWRSIDEILTLVGIVTAARPGYEIENALTGLRERFGEARTTELANGVVPMTPAGISSTEIREKVRNGRPIDDLVPAEVAAYIEGSRLYR